MFRERFFDFAGDGDREDDFFAGDFERDECRDEFFDFTGVGDLDRELFSMFDA